jgi:Calcineurin-like phosphoesterase
MTLHRKQRWCFSIVLAGAIALLSTAMPAGASAAPDPVIAAAGDISCDQAGTPAGSSCQQQATSDLLVGANPAGVLTLGDQQYEDGALSKFQGFYDPAWGRVKPITHPAPGNHEYGTKGATGYFSYFGAAAGTAGLGYYSYDIGAWHLISLDSNSPSSAQVAWLKSDLAASSARCTLAYWHHPRFSSGSTHGDNTSVAPFWDALYAAGADVVLNGHEHNYERFAPQSPSGAADSARGIREFVSGTGGRNHYPISSAKPNSQVHNSDTFGVLELSLHPSGYDWQFRPAAGGGFTDQGSGSCH